MRCHGSRAHPHRQRRHPMREQRRRSAESRARCRSRRRRRGRACHARSCRSHAAERTAVGPGRGTTDHLRGQTTCRLAGHPAELLLPVAVLVNGILVDPAAAMLTRVVDDVVVLDDGVGFRLDPLRALGKFLRLHDASPQGAGLAGVGQREKARTIRHDGRSRPPAAVLPDASDPPASYHGRSGHRVRRWWPSPARRRRG